MLRIYAGPRNPPVQQYLGPFHIVRAMVPLTITAITILVGAYRKDVRLKYQINPFTGATVIFGSNPQLVIVI